MGIDGKVRQAKEKILELSRHIYDPSKKERYIEVALVGNEIYQRNVWY